MLHLRWVRIVAAFVLAIGVIGCGGSGGSSESSNPEGTFSMQMDPTDGTELNTFEAEFDVDSGFIVGRFARVVYAGGFWDQTTVLDGVASTGFLDGSADFGDYVIEFQATFGGGQWTGTYEVWEGKVLVETGDLIIDRTGSGTANIAATWEGTFTFPIDGTLVEDWDIVFDQKGNDLAGSGVVEGAVVTVAGSIIGRRVVWEAAEILDGGDIWRCQGDVDSNADNMEGDVVKNGLFCGAMVGNVNP